MNIKSKFLELLVVTRYDFLKLILFVNKYRKLDVGIQILLIFRIIILLFYMVKINRKLPIVLILIYSELSKIFIKYSIECY